MATVAPQFDPALDILVVFDNTEGPEAGATLKTLDDHLVAAVPSFVDALGAGPTGLLDLHVGVVTPDLGTSGALDPFPGPVTGFCSGSGQAGVLQTSSALVSGNFLVDVANGGGARTTNYTGTLRDAVAALVDINQIACQFEQDLEAAKLALKDNPANAGFLRPDARLLILVVTDEDDCSMAHSSLLGVLDPTLGPLQKFRCTRFGVTCDEGGATPDTMNVVGTKATCHPNDASAYLTRVADYASFFAGLKADPKMVMFAGILGPTTPFAVELRVPFPAGGDAIPALVHSCSYTDSIGGRQIADPGVRIAAAASTFTYNSIASPCAEDLSGSLIATARNARNMLGDPCLPRDIALPADCQVALIVGGVENQLPACDQATPTTPCFSIAMDPALCPFGQQLKVSVTPAPPEYVAVHCKLP